MTTTRRWRGIPAVLSLAVIGFGLADHRTFAGWPLHKQQVVYATPVYTARHRGLRRAGTGRLYRTGPGRLYRTTAARRRGHAGTVATPRPRSPIPPRPPSPMRAQAPTTYAISTASAPERGQRRRPGRRRVPRREQGIRISNTVRNALFADLVAYYHSEEAATPVPRRSSPSAHRAREEFEALLEGEDNPELNSSERQDLNTLVDWVIAGGPTSGQRTYYPLGGLRGRWPMRPGSGYGVPAIPTRGWWASRPSTSRSSSSQSTPTILLQSAFHKP